MFCLRNKKNNFQIQIQTLFWKPQLVLHWLVIVFLFMLAVVVRSEKIIVEHQDGIVYSYFMPVCSIVELLPRGAMDDLMHYCTRPKSNSWTILQTGMK